MAQLGFWSSLDCVNKFDIDNVLKRQYFLSFLFRFFKKHFLVALKLLPYCVHLFPYLS